MPMPKKEAQPSGEGIDIEALAHGGADVFAAVCEGVAELLHGGRARFVHVVAADRDRIEFRHLLGRIFDDVGDDAHRWRGRIDIGVAHHELFEDVVLDGAGKFFGRNALLLTRHDEIREDRDHRAVHGHRHAHLVERNAGEKDLHVLDGIDGDTRLAHIARHARMIAVVTAMGGQIERHRKPHLPGGEVLAIEGVGFFGGGEARILADGPRTPGIHRAPHAAHERHQAGQRVGRFQPFKVGSGVKRLDGDAFG
jgi:hypothetical protein